MEQAFNSMPEWELLQKWEETCKKNDLGKLNLAGLRPTACLVMGFFIAHGASAKTALDLWVKNSELITDVIPVKKPKRKR